MTSRGVLYRQKHIRGDCFSFEKCVSDVTVEGGGPPPENFWFKWCKTCNFSRNKHGNGTFTKARDSVYDGRRDNSSKLEVIRICQFFSTIYNTGMRSEPEKIM